MTSIINIHIISVEVEFSSHYGNTATHTFIITQTEYDKLESALSRDPLHLDFMLITWNRVIAQVKNKSQLEMFTELETSRTILEDLIGEYGLNQSNSFEDPEFIGQIKEHIHKELLEEAKWDPRSVLGKLEFDRRLIADGIVFDDETCDESMEEFSFLYDDDEILKYRKEIEEGCPEGYTTLWTEHGFKYESMEN